MTAIRQLLVDVERRFQQAGIDSARVDAELLLAHVLQTTRSQLMIAVEISETQLHEYEILVRRRVLREPLQYITGSAAFRKIELSVGKGVLVPRPETELLVEITKRFVSAGTVLDVGAGSGCIGLSLATEVPNLNVIAVENSSSALAYLAKNAQALKPQFKSGSSFEFLAIDLADLISVRPDLVGKVAAVVSNPPYVPQLSEVAAEVKLFEPPQAVFADQNGYQIIDQVIKLAELVLQPGGLLAIEHFDQHGPTGIAGGVSARLKQRSGFSKVTAMDDLTGSPRFTYAFKGDG